METSSSSVQVTSTVQSNPAVSFSLNGEPVAMNCTPGDHCPDEGEEKCDLNETTDDFPITLLIVYEDITYDCCITIESK